MRSHVYRFFSKQQHTTQTEEGDRAAREAGLDPTANTSFRSHTTLARYLMGIQALLPYVQAKIKHVIGNRRLAHQKLAVYIERKRFLARWLREAFLPQDPNKRVILAVGDASFAPAFRGIGPSHTGPVLDEVENFALRFAGIVMLAYYSEHLTTQICSCCEVQRQCKVKVRRTRCQELFHLSAWFFLTN